MKLPNWLKPTKKLSDPCPLAGVAEVKYDPLKMHQYWETSNANDEDTMSLTGAASLPLDPKHLPMGTIIKMYIPVPADGE